MHYCMRYLSTFVWKTQFFFLFYVFFRSAIKVSLRKIAKISIYLLDLMISFVFFFCLFFVFIILFVMCYIMAHYIHFYPWNFTSLVDFVYWICFVVIVVDVTSGARHIVLWTSGVWMPVDERMFQLIIIIMKQFGR